MKLVSRSQGTFSYVSVVRHSEMSLGHETLQNIKKY